MNKLFKKTKKVVIVAAITTLVVVVGVSVATSVAANALMH